MTQRNGADFYLAEGGFLFSSVLCDRVNTAFEPSVFRLKPNQIDDFGWREENAGGIADEMLSDEGGIDVVEVVVRGQDCGEAVERRRRGFEFGEGVVTGNLEGAVAFIEDAIDENTDVGTAPVTRMPSLAAKVMATLLVA